MEHRLKRLVEADGSYSNGGLSNGGYFICAIGTEPTVNEADVYRVRVSAAILRPPGELLVVRESKRALAIVNLPGGAPQLGETLEHAAVREVREETGYDVLTTEVAFIAEHRSERWAVSTLEICFYAEVIVPLAHPPSHHDAVFAPEWLALDHPDVRRHLRHTSIFHASKRGRYIDQTSRVRGDTPV